jgi:uncharacterized protein (TIGR02466 family)
MKSNIIKLFPTMVGTYDMSELVSTIDIDNILNSNSQENGLVDGSRSMIIPHLMSDFSNLMGEIQNCVNDFSKQLSLNPTKIYDSWINILNEKGSVGSHRHYNSVISGALYLHIADNSSSIYFINPTEGLRMLEMGYVSSYESEYTPNIHCITPNTGQLILFPSWIEHYVGVNQSSLRITLSFNTK